MRGGMEQKSEYTILDNLLEGCQIVVRPYFETTNGSILVTSCWFFQYASNSAGVR
jgi:hypothetical protein